MAGKQEFTAIANVDTATETSTEASNRETNTRRTDEENCERYGCFSCHPPSLTFLASGRFFLLIMCMLIFSDAFNIGTLSGALTSLETRYELKASELGLIESLYEAGNLIFVIFIVHFVGRQEHRRPLWIGLGAITMALGTAIAFSPQFIFSAYEPDWRSTLTNQTEEPLTCNSEGLSGSPVDQCETGDQEELMRRESRMAYGIVLFGEILVGIGWTPVMPLSMSYIDDNVNTKTSAMFIGIIQSMFGIGTIFGFLASAAVAAKWVDFYRVDAYSLQLSPEDNLWVGAWWLGLAITSSLYFLSSLPFFGFPRKLWSQPSADTKFMLESSTTTDEPGPEEDLVDPGSTSRGSVSLFDLPVALWRLLCNPIYIWLNVGGVSEMAVIAGLVTFFPKYLETQFSLSPPEANFFMAVIPVPAVAIGSFLGGLLVKKLGLKGEGAIKLALACSTISLVGQVALLGVGCENAGIAGVDVAYPDDSRMDLTFVNLTSTCNVHCGCSSVDPETVCGADGITYYSACYAGCRETINGTYFNCECVQDLTNQNDSMAGVVHHGACPMSNCNMLAPFLAIMFVVALSSSCEEVPQLMVLMRCVKKTDKSLSLGLRHVFNRIFGNIPAPLYYGAAIDGTCRLWQQFCGEQGECWAYSLPDFRYTFMGVTVALKTLSASSYLVAWMLLKRKAGNAKTGSSGDDTGSYRIVGANGEEVPEGLVEEDEGTDTGSVENESPA